LDGLAKKTTIPNEFRESLVRLSRIGIRADNRRFHNLLGSLVAALEHKDRAKVIGIFFRILFLSGRDSGLVFSRRVHYRLVWPFSIPVDSPMDKRGIVWSGNRGLRFGIGADNGRLLSSN
jgi:hypothetical protein